MEALLPRFRCTTSPNESGYDCLVICGSTALKAAAPSEKKTVEDADEVDTNPDRVRLLFCPDAPGKRIVFVSTGNVADDYADERNLSSAAELGIKRAVQAGSRKPLILLENLDRFPLSVRVSLLGLLHGVYTPIEIRETKKNPDSFRKIDAVGVFCSGFDRMSSEVSLVCALEQGRVVARDIGGSDPERMAAPAIELYVEKVFRNSCVKLDVIREHAVFEKEYPLLAAVNRCCRNVPRHAGRLIFLEYNGEGDIQKTLMLVGKGITYDTGGADVKTGGAMAGMHRDKCGAAAVAGFFQFLALYKPKNIRVLGAMAVVRNSIGSECYVSDEIITSRAGVRVRVCNTDAEGRMVMADVLCHMKEKAMHEVNPYIFTVATLTGHVIRCYGDNYTSVLDNGPAWRDGVSRKITEAGDAAGEPCEVTRLRKEDFAFISPPSEYEDVIQSGGKPSTMTNRGHQYPAAFLNRASGMDKHGSNSTRPLRYTHMDIAGSSGPFPGVPTGAPIVALAHAFVI